MSDTTSAQTVDPTVAVELLSLDERISRLEAKMAEQESAVRPYLGYSAPDERDVVPALALSVIDNRLTIGDAVVADLNLGGLIKGRVVGFRGADVLVDGGKLGAHCVDPRRVIVCPGEWVK